MAERQSVGNRTVLFSSEARWLRGLRVKATEFEVRHPVLVQQLIIVAAWATYLIDREDVVWRFIKHYPERRLLEHSCFLIATLLIGAGAALCTWARSFPQAIMEIADPMHSARSSLLRYPHQLGDWLFAAGLASLLPLSGSVLLISGESIRQLRLVRRYDLAIQQNLPTHASEPPTQRVISGPRWRRAFRVQAVKWGLLVTMIVFTITLVDRQADILAAASVLVAMFLNLPAWLTRRSAPTVG